ncbi:hypothetical protein ZHS_105 [Edwardsiella phage vB_EpM_ZHS]|jgi:hypothetical protein|nr:hypothetical protein ZHS_105 [Edwardsiella phage vB_EpM_ZHS]
MKTRMKMTCTGKTETPQGDTQILLQALYEGPEGENRAFADAAPAANLSALISKGKAALENFIQGEVYYVDIELVVSVREREGTTAMTTAEIKTQADGLADPQA